MATITTYNYKVLPFDATGSVDQTRGPSGCRSLGEKFMEKIHCVNWCDFIHRFDDKSAVVLSPVFTFLDGKRTVQKPKIQ